MASLLYVRTSSGGTGPDVNVDDLGIIIATSASWTQLASALPHQAGGPTGQFTSRELRDSVDLWVQITSGNLEWSKDGVSVETALSYKADYMITEDLTDDSLTIDSLTVSGVINTPNGELVSHLDGGANKHDASEIDVEGTYPNIPGSPGNLELVISGINTALNTASSFAFGTVTGDTGSAIADVGSDSIAITGAGSITTVAGDNPEILSIDGTALLPRDGSRPMIGTLDMNDNDINGIQDMIASGVVTFTAADLLLPVDTVAPTGLGAGQIVVVSDIAYIYDATRTKWLSIHRDNYVTDRNANATNTYMRVGEGTATSQTGIRMKRNGTITALAAQTDTAETWTFEVRKNDVVTPIASLVISGAQGAQSNTVNINVSAGDELQFFVNGSGIDHPVAIVEVAWRL